MKIASALSHFTTYSRILGRVYIHNINGKTDDINNGHQGTKPPKCLLFQVFSSFCEITTLVIFLCPKSCFPGFLWFLQNQPCSQGAHLHLCKTLFWAPFPMVGR